MHFFHSSNSIFLKVSEQAFWQLAVAFSEYCALQSDRCSNIGHKSGLISGGESQPIIVIGSTGDSDSVAQGTRSRLNYLANMATCRYWVYLLYLLSAICLGHKSYCRLMLILVSGEGKWQTNRLGAGSHTTLVVATHQGSLIDLIFQTGSIFPPQ